MDEILVRVFYAVAASIILTVLVYFIPSLRSAVYSGPFRYRYPASHDQIEGMLADANPGLTWKTSKAAKAQQPPVIYPVWDCWVLFHELEFLEELSTQVLDRFDEVFYNAKICALTTPALFFLGILEEELRLSDAIIFPFDKRFSRPVEWVGTKLVLFDMNLNTGKTMCKAIEAFEKDNWPPTHCAVMLYNDLVPETEHYCPSATWEQRISYLFLATSIMLRQTESKGKEPVTDIEIIREAFANRRSWEDKAVQEALKRQLRDSTEIFN
ncbi:MAG: hypothetical protein MN733_10735 [Nitrososphaera sp.]|nr:hypothetical protein [Nitrososphaera sp.]